MKLVRTFIPIFLALFSVTLISWRTRLYSYHAIKIDPQISTYNMNISYFKIFHFGNKRLISSLLWIKTLLDSDLKHYKKRDLNSWMYLRFNTITQIDPFFLEAYLFGGQYLSVIKDDIVGASDIFDRGILQYPRNFDLNFYSGIHEYKERANPQMAAKRLRAIMYHPRAPFYLPSLVGKMMAQSGNIENAFFLIQTAYQQEREPLIKEKYYTELYSIKAELDLNCLNEDLHLDNNCSHIDLDGNPYQFSGGKFAAIKKWDPFRPK